MNKVLMIKDGMVHYVPYELVNEFIDCGWEKADLTAKSEVKTNTTKSTTKKRSKKVD